MRRCPFIGSFDLEEFLRPVGAERFFDEHWEKQWCVLRGSTPERFAGLLELSDIEHLLGDRETPDGSIILTGGGKGSLAHATEGVSQLGSALQGFADGRTILAKSANYRLPQLATLSAQLEKALGMRVHLNLYLTPVGSQGFKPHFDTHDVFVMQILGTKVWRVGGQTVALPLPEQAPDRACSPAPDAATLTIRPGDILYIPRGIIHEAWSCDETSLHITVGVNNATFLDVAVAALREAALRDVRLRVGLPPAALLSGNREDLAHGVLALCRDAVSEDDLIAVIDRMADQFFASRRQPLTGSLTTIASLLASGLDGRFRLRPDALVKVVETTGGDVCIIFAGREVTLPARGRAAVELCVSGREFELADLPSNLDQEERAVIVRRLLKEGLLQKAS
jgi:hypothetical protein